MLIKLAVILLAVPGLVSNDAESAKDKFYRQSNEIRAEYRVAVAQQIRSAQRVELFLLRFDGLKANGYGSEYNEDRAQRFEVAPYGESTKIINRILLDRVQSNELLKSLADQMQKPTHTGGALCHFPVHGIRVYSDLESETLIYSGTFSWKCENFGFAYPSGTDWLDTSERLKKNVNALLPIPVKELERFEQKYPSKRRANEVKAPKK